jgi:hypothetical protein
MKYSWEGLRNANQYVGQSSSCWFKCFNQLVSDLGYNRINAVPVDANGNLVSTEKMGYKLGRFNVK